MRGRLSCGQLVRLDTFCVEIEFSLLLVEFDLPGLPFGTYEEETEQCSDERNAQAYRRSDNHREWWAIIVIVLARGSSSRLTSTDHQCSRKERFEVTGIETTLWRCKGCTSLGSGIKVSTAGECFKCFGGAAETLTLHQ